MNDLASSTHRVVFQKDYAEVFPKEPVAVQETKFSAAGVEVSNHLPSDKTALGQLAAAMNRMPALAFNWAGNGQWNVDANAGVQRFHGCVTTAQMTKAFKTKFGFPPELIKEIFSRMKKLAKDNKYPSVPWYH